MDNRECVDNCPKGYVDQWSSHTEFMGRVCMANSGYSGSLLAAFFGIFVGLLICLMVLIIGVFFIKKHKLIRTKNSQLIVDNQIEHSEFLQQIGEMRPYAGHFLFILNDVRRQIRKSYMGGEMDSIQSVKPLIRDLARILMLLNRPPEMLTVAPKDWPQLYAWMEQVIRRHKPQRNSPFSQFPLNESQLIIDRLPVSQFSDNYNFNNTSKFDADVFWDNDSHILRKNGRLTHSFKPHFFDSSISLRDESQALNPIPFRNQVKNVFNNGCLLTDFNRSSLWLEDEFNMLGLRPQDEITTEL